LDLDKLLSEAGIQCSIERLQRAQQFSIPNQTDALCDNRSVLNPVLLTTATEYKEDGNTHFKNASYIAAILSWSRGLRIEPNNDPLLLNRSLGYIKIEWYEAALRDAQAVISRPSIPAHAAKARSRIAWAEYGLGLYNDALRRFELNDSILTSTERNQWIARCKQRILEQSSGAYKWDLLFTEWQSNYKDSLPIPRLDIADYIGPAEVRAMEGRGGGRGVVATRDIKCGELLVCS
jgi:tetratricopeptide (TPR) repeat protein